MWVTLPKLSEGLKTIKSWEFQYKTCAFVWVKANKRYNPDQINIFQHGIDDYMGMGAYTRANAELCLLGIKGKIQIKSHNVRQIIYHPVMKHSKKPDIVREKIVELCGELPRIELFAREKFNGWDYFGNELDI